MYNSFKTAVSEVLNLSKDALHVHFGILLFLVIAVALRKLKSAYLLAWLAVAFLALGNEYMDLRGHGGFAGNLGESAKDILNTMFWPTVALLALEVRSRRTRTSNT